MLDIKAISEVLGVSIGKVKQAIKALELIGAKGERQQYYYDSKHIDKIKQWLRK